MLGLILVILGVALAVLSNFVDRRAYVLLSIGVVLIGLGVIFGVDTVSLSNGSP